MRAELRAMTETWGPDRIAELTHRWKAGETTATIGRAMGLTKNSVIAKARRVGLDARPNPVKIGNPKPRTAEQRRIASIAMKQIRREQKRAAAIERKINPAVRPKPKTFAPVVSGPKVRLVSAPYACCWPIGDVGGRGFRFCDEPHHNTGPYCSTHAAVAYLPRAAA